MEKINAHLISNKGCIRENNEDNFYFFNNINEYSESDISMVHCHKIDEPLLFGVFDGMGGYHHGEMASLICAKICQEYELHNSYLKDDMMAMCYISNDKVCSIMKEQKSRIGSTASMLAFYNGQVSICNIGDSPIFLYRDHQLTPIYEEHTERRMYEELYGVQPHKKYRLTQNIGVFSSEVIIKPYVSELKYNEDDIYLICSDGLTDMVSLETIQEALDNYQENTIDYLLNLALENGGRDNITMILIKIEGGDE